MSGGRADFEARSVLVTGGAGFIGSHLVDALLERGARVRVLDDLSTGRLENLAHCAERIELVEGDIRDLATCNAACRGQDVVFHQAALGSVPRSMKDPATSIAVNVQGTANVLSAARDAATGVVVYASSSSVYGDSEELPKVEGREGTVLSPYAASKEMDEALAEVFAAAYGMRLVGLRYFNVYGPRQRPDGPYAAVIPRFFKACLEGVPAEIHGDGEQSRDFTYVADAVQANLLSASAGLDGHRVFNVAGGRRVTINDLAAAVNRVGGGPDEPLHGPPRPGDVRHSLADLSRIRDQLGYEPTTGLEAGLEASLEHYRQALGVGATGAEA